MGGVESQFAVNYLGHYALCKGLLPELIRTGSPVAPARIILVASVLHKVGGQTTLESIGGEIFHGCIVGLARLSIEMLRTHNVLHTSGRVHSARDPPS